MIYEFGTQDLHCGVETLGAELVSVRYQGKERLWQNESGAWSGHAPILFPYGGNCALIENGVQYPCPRHGFVRDQQFTLWEKKENEITLLLRSSEETKKVFPHDFSLFITYMVVGNCLKITYKAVNEGKETMYAGFCCHDSFALDDCLDAYEAVFENDEHFVSLYCLYGDGRMTGEFEDLGKGKVLRLNREFLHNNSIILKNTNSHSVTLKKQGEDTRIATVRYPDFPHLLFWQADNSRMVCIEPWGNLPDDLYAPPQEFSKKQGVTALAQGESLVCRHEIEYF